MWPTCNDFFTLFSSIFALDFNAYFAEIGASMSGACLFFTVLKKQMLLEKVLEDGGKHRVSRNINSTIIIGLLVAKSIE